MIKTKRVAIQCPQCGSTDFEVPDNVQDDDIVTCHFCGLEMPLHELRKLGLEQAKEVVIPEAKKAIEEALKNIFKRR